MDNSDNNDPTERMTPSRWTDRDVGRLLIWLRENDRYTRVRVYVRVGLKHPETLRIDAFDPDPKDSNRDPVLCLIGMESNCSLAFSLTLDDLLNARYRGGWSILVPVSDLVADDEYVSITFQEIQTTTYHP